MLGTPGYHRLVRSLRGMPSVSVVLTSEGAGGRVQSVPRTFVSAAIEDVVKRSGHPLGEVLVASAAPLRAGVRADLDAACGAAMRAVVVPSPSMSDRLNAAAARATSEYLLLLHDDVDVVTDGFLATMLALAQDDDVGMVGCRLLATDGTLVHAGHVYMGRPGSAYTGFGTDDDGLERPATSSIARSAACRRRVP